MPNIRVLQIFICLLLICLTTCSSEKEENSILERKLRERVEAVNKFFKENKMNNESATITITSPIKISLNLKENSAVTDTEMKIEIHSHSHKNPVSVPIRITWRRYEDGYWQIEYVIPQEISMWLLFDKIIKKKMR